MKKSNFGFLFIAFLAGCTSTPPAPEAVYIPVPAECPVTLVPERPLLPIELLTVTSTPDDVIKAYVKTVLVLQGTVIELEDLLRAYVPSELGNKQAPRQ